MMTTNDQIKNHKISAHVPTLLSSPRKMTVILFLAYYIFLRLMN